MNLSTQIDVTGLARRIAHRCGAKLAVLLLVVYSLVGAATLVYGTFTLVHNPWENTYFESPQTYAAIYAVRTGKLYIPMSEPPYSPQAYAPLYYTINAVIAKTSHLSIDGFIVHARELALFCFLLCGVLIALISRAGGSAAIYSVIAGLVFLGEPDIMGWNVSPRPDMLFLLAMLFSLGCAVVWSNRWYGFAGAGFFAGIAFLIKQPGGAVALAIFLVLVFHRKIKEAIWLCASTALPIAITFYVLYVRRDPFFQQILFVGKSRWSIVDAAHLLYLHCWTPYWVFPALITMIGAYHAFRLDFRTQMIASFALVSWIVGLAGLPQLGGYTNYLIPGLAGSALLLPYGVQFMEPFVRKPLPLVLASSALIWATTSGYTQTRILTRYFRAPTGDSLAWLKPYRVLSDLTTLNLHGRQPNLLDPFGAHVLELTGNWSAAPVMEALENGDYDLIILTRAGFKHEVPFFRGVSYFSPEEVGIINSRYEVVCSTLASIVYKPRGREIPVTPEMFDRFFGARCGTGYRRFPMDLKLAVDQR